MSKQNRDQNVHNIERFLSAYNCIDQSLRNRFKQSSRVGFSDLIRNYLSCYPTRSSDANLLRISSRLRNILTHDQTGPYHYPATPAPWIVDQLETFAESFKTPKCVIPAFQANVCTLSIEDSLSHAFEMIRSHNFSQLPVYSEKRFRGLLTENGITRWLAHTEKQETIFDFEEITVRAALREEENRNNCEFLNREALIDDAMVRFRANTTLEAIIITHHGKKTESPLGIITRWNVLESELN